MTKRKIAALLKCRTCGSNNPNNEYNELMSFTKKFPTKTLWDLLQEVTRIEEVTLACVDKLPLQLCTVCSRKLRNAYDFAVQTRQTQVKLLAELNESEAETETKIKAVIPASESDATNNQTGTTDCLQEALISECAEELVQVKIESEVDTSALPEIGLITLKEPLQPTRGNVDPLVMCYEETKLEEKIECGLSEEDADNLPLAQRKVILSNLSLNVSQEDAAHPYKCAQCGKIYLRPKNLVKHMKSHNEIGKPKRSQNLCERRKVNNTDVNLCKPNGCKMIQCMICLRKFNKFDELRRHLVEHGTGNICIGDRYGEPLEEIAESFYAHINNVTNDQLVARMRKDLIAGNYSHFYSITNESGYELSLDSSETESENEQESLVEQDKKPASQQHKYICELCLVCVRRKYQLLDHQVQQHTWSEAQYDCRRCNARFVSDALLEHHHKTLCKNTQKRFLCNKCPQRFRWKHNYKAHIKEHRSMKETLACMECDRTYDDKKSLTIHMLTIHADESKLLPCNWCSRKFYRRDYLYKHLKRHGIQEKDIPLAETLLAASAKAHGTKHIECKVCKVKFTRIMDLRKHLLLELKTPTRMHKNYESMANYSITNAAGYELHIEDSETEDEKLDMTIGQSIAGNNSTVYTCDVCLVQCRRKHELMQHQRAMHRFVSLPHACDQCIFKSVSKKILDHHRRTQCANTEKTLACSQCGYKFMWPENLSLHMRLQHGVTANELSPTSVGQSAETAPRTPKLLQCPHCDRTYLLQTYLNNHIRDVHIEGKQKKRETLERKFLCSLCGLETQTSANLIIHMRRHTGERPFKCLECNMGFIRHSELIIHQRRHTGERPYACTVCGKDFARSDKLKRHMLTHSGLKPYKCTYCDKSYRYSKDLKLHLQQHTGETPFECGNCGERFMQNKALEKHRMMRRHFDANK